MSILPVDLMSSRMARPTLVLTSLTLLLAPAVGCRHSGQNGKPAEVKSESGLTAGISVIHPERRDIRMTVVQPGTIEAFETTPIYSRIAGYVQEYRFNIGDRVKEGDILIDMWIPDLVQTHAQKLTSVHRAEVQIDVAQSALSGRRGKGPDGRGPDRFSPGRSEAGAGQLLSLGVGIQET